MSAQGSKWRHRWRQFAWLVGLWAAGVGTIFLVAELLRLSMTAVGLKSH